MATKNCAPMPEPKPSGMPQAPMSLREIAEAFVKDPDADVVGLVERVLVLRKKCRCQLFADLRRYATTSLTSWRHRMKAEYAKIVEDVRSKYMASAASQYGRACQEVAARCEAIANKPVRELTDEECLDIWKKITRLRRYVETCTVDSKGVHRKTIRTQ